MKKKIVILLLSLILLVSVTGCKELERSVKDTKSGWTGLDRVVYVYDNAGNLLKTYEGDIDIEINEYGNKVKFELDGKRIMLNNATVIVEEK